MNSYYELRDRDNGAWYMRAYFDVRNYADERRAWFVLWLSLGDLGIAARAAGYEIAPEIVRHA